MTKMAAMLIYIKNLKNLLLKNQLTDCRRINMKHWVPEHYQDFSNDDLWLTLTFFTAKSNIGKCL